MSIENRAAYHHYFIEQKLIAGIVLAGTEVKSIRDGKVSFNDSYCFFQDGELWLKSLHISEYKFGTYTNHIPTADRKLLLHKKELRRLEQKLKESGQTIVPLKMFFSEKGIVKVEIGVAKGKKLFDKRESLKEKDSAREIRRKYAL
jgi:SsrA-binding protein